MNRHYFHLSIGPVQGFVASARRTRDFWTGSFILSWLAGVAMKASTVQGAQVEFPRADQHYLAHLSGEVHGKGPEQGCVPNRFMASFEPDSDFDSEQVVHTVREAWRELARVVFEADLADTAGEPTRAVWQRQVENYWEIYWIISPDRKDTSALERRKSWRNHIPPGEPGVKCMMMDGLQELSGYPSPTAPHGEQINKFWDDLRNRGRAGMKTDLRRGEMLCAVAFIKRRFARHFAKINAPMPGGWHLKGWAVDPGRPSVAHMAAVPWLKEAMEAAKGLTVVNGLLWRFHDEARKLTGDYGEWSNNIRCIREASPHRQWGALDGNVFFKSLLENENIYEDRKQAGAVITALEDLRKAAGLPKPAAFYAVLLMDGDNLGAQMGEPEKQNSITEGLAAFTTGTDEIIRRCNGFPVYTGGDDLLAVLPLADALPCALELRQWYAACFKGRGVCTSLSGAVVYAHIKTPLTRVLRDGHRLLDQVAKERHGRDTLAVRIRKPGGYPVEWAMPWEKALEDDPVQPGKMRLVVKRIADELARDDESRGYSNRFFYKIRQLFLILNPQHEDEEPILDQEGAVDLLAAEYYSSGLCLGYEKAKRMIHARAMVRPLLEQCRLFYRRETQAGGFSITSGKDIRADGALLIRFLVQKGVEQ